MPLIQGIRGDCPDLEHVLTLDPHGGNGVLGWDEFIHGAERRPALTEVSPDDMASIIYTSGTTDRPKGVMLKHSAFAFAPSQSRAGAGLDR